MSTKIKTVVIGGGAMGLSVGYNLLKKGMETIVLEGDYLNAGSTGRNLGVLKERIPHAVEQDNVDLIKLAQQGLRLHGRLSSETGINTFYRKSGCLTIAKSEEELEHLRKLQSHFHGLGLEDEFLSASAIEKQWPYIDASSLVGGFYSSREAMAHPFGVVWAYVESIKEMGGRVEKQNKVKTLRRSPEGYIIESEMGTYEAENVVIACAAHSSGLSEQLGFNVPITPLRKEVLISEPIRPFFGPAIERLSEDYEMAQTMRGEVLGTMGYLSPGYDLSECTSGFLSRFADETLPMIPSFRHLSIIRQWTGICDKTPDEKPVVGSLDDGLYITCGHYDYGITLAPIVGRLLTDYIIEGVPDPLLKAFDPLRFS